ncbi:hypothetical protein [Streptomyces sp. NPDC001537]
MSWSSRANRRGAHPRPCHGELVEGDEVLVAIGSQSNTEWLEGSGLAVGDGVVRDEYCEAAPRMCTRPVTSPAGTTPCSAPRCHAEVAVSDGDLADSRFVAAHRTGER